MLIYSYNDTEVSELSSHLQENNVSIIFLAQWRMFLVHLHLYLYSGSKLLAGQRWSPMLKSICCNCPTCDCYCIAGKDRPGGVGLYKGQQFSIDKRKVVGMQKLFIQNDKLPKPRTQTNINPPLRVFWWTWARRRWSRATTKSWTMPSGSKFQSKQLQLQLLSA